MKLTASILITFLGIFINITAQDYSFKETFDVKTPAELSILTSDGKINVHPSDKNEIEIYFIAKKKGKLLDISKEELLEFQTLEITRTANSLEITAKPKYKNMPQSWNNYIVLSFEIFAPSQTSCDLKTSDGNIYIEGLQGKQQCKTSDGNIILSNIDGDTYATTSDGDIQVQNCEGNSDVKTSDGNIKLNNINGNLYAKTSDGHIDFEKIKGGITGVTSDGRIEGELASIDYPTELKTSDGGIRLTIPEGSGFDLEMRGENLHADFKEFNGDVSDNYIHGKVNGGGEPIKLSSSDGRISLEFE